MAFSRARFDTLMQKDHNELVELCQRLENTVSGLQRKLLFLNPSTVLEELQLELIHLQEENQSLRNKNRKLKRVVSEHNLINAKFDDDDENDSGNVMNYDDERDDDDDEDNSSHCSSCTSDSDSSSSSSSTTASYSSNGDDFNMFVNDVENSFDPQRQTIAI